MSPRARFVRSAALFAVSLLLALLAAELVWRQRPTASHGPTTSPRYVDHDPGWGWRYRPGVRLRHATDEFDVEVAINALGYREQPSMPASPPDVVVLGDSYAFGWGVEASETFAARLEEHLGRPVWNLALSGTGPDQQLLVLRERGRLTGAASAFAPRTVLVNFCGNDLPESMRSISYRRRKPRFELAGGELRLIGTPVPESFLERHSLLYRSVVGQLRERAETPLAPAGVSAARELVLALYAELEREAATLGAELIVLHEGARWLAAGLARQDVATLDLAPALARAAAEGPVRFARDGHWNARGHAAVAREIASVLAP